MNWDSLAEQLAGLRTQLREREALLQLARNGETPLTQTDEAFMLDLRKRDLVSINVDYKNRDSVAVVVAVTDRGMHYLRHGR